MRVSIFVFAAIVLAYAITVDGKPIYDMVSSAYQVTLVGAFVPLAFGLYWRAATTQGALASLVMGVSVWLTLTLFPDWGKELKTLLPDWVIGFPSQLAGLLASITGMIAGSLLPQLIANKKASEEATYSVHPEGI